MPTIEYSGNPSGYADRGRAEHDNVFPTLVTATAEVTNSGNALGRARIRIFDITSGPEGLGDIKSQAGFDINDEPGERTRTISTSFNLLRDEYLQLEIDVIDEKTGATLARTTTSVNTYDIPQVATLTSGGITITVV